MAPRKAQKTLGRRFDSGTCDYGKPHMPGHPAVDWTRSILRTTPHPPPLSLAPMGAVVVLDLPALSIAHTDTSCPNYRGW